MQRIIDNILKFKDVLVFLILLLFSIFLIINSNYYHKYKVLNLSNNFVADVLKEYSTINEYIKLKGYNIKLIKENVKLKNELQRFNIEKIDSVFLKQKFIYTDAKIITNNISLLKNYLIINKGSRDGVIKEMGVTSSEGIIGIVNEISENYSSVMSVLNIDTKINAKVKRTSHFGTLEWDGLSSENLLLNDIPETAKIKVGDSIITGGMSLIFPEGINIGVVSEIIKQKKRNDTIVDFVINNQVKIAKIQFKENYLKIVVKLHTDMNNLNIVYVIESLNKEEFKNIKK